MEIKDAIQALLDSGMSQRSLAKAVGTNQPTIHRCLNGAEIRYSLGKRIEQLYEEVIVGAKTDNKAKQKNKK